MQNQIRILLVSIAAAAASQAAPQLRLTSAAIGPILVNQGANATINAAQVPYAYNIGSGSLNLKVSSSDSWLVPSLGAVTRCFDSPSCTPVQLALQTSGLAKGTYTGFVTVADPNAIDSPQTISVTVAVGGGEPGQITFYASPNGTASSMFKAGTGAGANATTQSGGSWLSLANSGFGSFQFSTTFTVTADATNLAEGDYNGSIAVSGSSFSADNHSIPVVFHVTTQPIAQPTSASVQFQIAQGAVKQNFPIVLLNTGQGTLTVSGATATTSSGGGWLTAVTSSNVITLTADASTLSPGKYGGTLTIMSNAVNGPTIIPVQLTVVAAGPPVVSYGGVVNVFTNSTDDGLSRGDVVAVYGNQFTAADPQVSNLPLNTNFAGSQVLVNGQAVPVQYVSASQINIQIPYDAQLGNGTLMVVRNGQQSNTVGISINAAAPVLLPFQGGPYVLAQTASGGYEGYSPSIPAHAGDTVVFYAVGMGATSPAVAAGTAAPSSPLANVTPVPTICFGGLHPINPTGTCSAPDFAGLTPGFFGLYQINFTIPSTTPTGNAVQIFVQVGEAISNILTIAIQ